MTSLSRSTFTAGVATLAVLVSTGASFARPDARAMTCQQTQNLIRQQGAVVITTGQHTYERFVSRTGYCYHPEVRHITYISTRDTDQCPVYNCERPIRFFDD